MDLSFVAEFVNQKVCRIWAFQGGRDPSSGSGRVDEAYYQLTADHAAKVILMLNWTPGGEVR